MDNLCASYIKRIRSCNGNIALAKVIADLPEFYYIFSKKHSKYQKRLMDYCAYIPMLHIITTRKISVTKYTLRYIRHILINKEYITEFLSFYTHTEIMKIIFHDIFGKACYTYNNINYMYNFLLSCIITDNLTLLSDHLLNYMQDHNMKIIDDNRQCSNTHKILFLDDSNIQTIAKHEKIVAFNKSMRMAWITSCQIF